ncbi:MAG: glycoside hydrolase family 97 C-terminal domain-containing protein, partial [Bacteroidales bacterium]|nr:glycoside hydrolase family 97 C-terminal domain-containing protein [Bacteroidales bacterium]
LEAGKTYAARLYLDAEDAHWDENPTAYTIVNKEVEKGETLVLKLAAGGGAAVSFMLVE